MAIDMITYEFLKRYVEGANMGENARPRGAWEQTPNDNKGPYKQGDYVTYNNVIYIWCNTNDSSVNHPQPGTDSTYWQRIVGVNPEGIYSPDENNNLIIEGNTSYGQNNAAFGSENVASGKAFKIVAEPSGTVGGTGIYTLDSVEGIEVGMTYSAVTSVAAYHQGTIQSINPTNKTVTVNNYTGYSLNANTDDPDNYNFYNTFLLDEHPELGTINIGANAAAFGQGVNAHNVATFAQGKNTVAIGKFSHAEGFDSIAGDYSHAEGTTTQAIGSSSHTEGQDTKTTIEAQYSHAEGNGTTATGRGQHVQGQFNIPDNEKSTKPGFNNYKKYAHIVGNGLDEETLSNAHTLDWDGNAWFAGEVYTGGTEKEQGQKLVTEAQLLNKRDIDDFSPIASMTKEQVERVSLVGITDITYETTDSLPIIADNYVAANGTEEATFFINFKGNARISIISTHLMIEDNFASGVVKVDGVELRGVEHEQINDQNYTEYTFNGDIKKGIEIQAGTYTKWLFTTFSGSKIIYSDGFMSGEQAEKLDNLDTQIGDIDTALDELHSYAQALISGGEA